MIEKAEKLPPLLVKCLTVTRSLLDQGQLAPEVVVYSLGNGMTADEAVPAALYAFAASEGDFNRAVLTAIRLGGDTNTIAAMAGALAGALVGEEGITAEWLAKAEDGAQGRRRITEVADMLAEMITGHTGRHPSMREER